MTILFLVRRFYPLIGGVEKHVLEVSKVLLKKGHHVVVLTEKIGNSPAKELLAIDNATIPLEIYRISVGREDRFKKFRIWKELWIRKKLFTSADIVHCHDVFFWYMPFRFLFPKKNVYTTFHGYETVFPPKLNAKIIRKISERLSDGCMIVGDFIKKWYGTKPDVVTYGGVRWERERMKNLGGKLRIVFIGRLEKDTGFTTYVTSLQEYKRKHGVFTLDVYGDGQLKDIGKKVGTIHGFSTDLESAFSKADIVFASSYLVMLEALAYKKIVIAVYDNELKEDYLRMSPFAKYIYICGDHTGVLAVLQKIEKKRSFASNTLKKGAIWARKQSWEKLTREYMKLWKQKI